MTCERLYPNYVYFSDNFNFGEPSALKDANDFLYDCMFEDNPDKMLVDKLIKKVEKNTPNTDDFQTHFVSSALDTCTSICDSLEFVLDKSFSHIEYISSYATDSVHMYIQEKESLDFNADKNFQQKIDTHPFMQREINIQTGIISFLNNTKGLDSGDIATLLTLQDNNGRSNLDL